MSNTHDTFVIEEHPNNPTGIKPVQDWVLVKLLSQENVSPGGLIILKEQREKQQKGLVIDCGPGKYNGKGTLLPLEVKAGDNVYFGVYKGVVIGVGGDDYLMMREKDITAVEECKTQ